MAVLGLRFCARAFSSCGKWGHSSSRCAGLSLSRPLLLRSTGSRRTGSVVAVHGPSCSAACGIFPDQGTNPCPLHWQADSQPLCHQGSPKLTLLIHHSASFPTSWCFPNNWDEVLTGSSLRYRWNNIYIYIYIHIQWFGRGTRNATF